MSPHWTFFSKSGQSDQMTMPARRASKFSAKRRAVLLLMIFQSLISQAVPGFCEPWSECQPGETGPQGLGEPPGGVGGTAGPCDLKAFLIRESKNPFRQAWLGNKVPVVSALRLLQRVRRLAGFFAICIDFRAPKPFAAVSQLPAALRRPQKKDAPGFVEHVYCQFSHI